MSTDQFSPYGWLWGGGEVTVPSMGEPTQATRPAGAASVRGATANNPTAARVRAASSRKHVNWRWDRLVDMPGLSCWGDEGPSLGAGDHRFRGLLDSAVSSAHWRSDWFETARRP